MRGFIVCSYSALLRSPDRGWEVARLRTLVPQGCIVRETPYLFLVADQHDLVTPCRGPLELDL